MCFVGNFFWRVLMVEALISIVLPTHNGRKYIEQSIRSCQEQAYGHWELVVVDDGSTDDTPAIVAGFTKADPRIRGLRHPEKRGLPAALNTGFADARGDYLTWTSDDNLYAPEALEVMAAFLTAHPDTDIVYADCREIDNDGKVTGYRAVGPPLELLDRNCVGACFLFRRSVFGDVGGYDERLFLVEDYDFWLRASMRHRMEPMHRPLYHYRTHSGALSERYADKMRDARIRHQIATVWRLGWVDGSRRASKLIGWARYAGGRWDWRLWLKAVFLAFFCSPKLVLSAAGRSLCMRFRSVSSR